MTFLDLSPGRAEAEALMCDRCTVKRDPEGSLDDDVDPDTFQLIPIGPDASTIYEGKCLAGRPRWEARSSEGGQQVYRRVRNVRFPHGSPPFRAGDLITFTISTDVRSNPDLVGQTLRVFNVDDRSIAVTRILRAEDDTGARTR